MNHSSSHSAAPLMAGEADLIKLAEHFFRSNPEVGAVVLGKNGDFLSFNANGDPLKSYRPLKENVDVQNGPDSDQSRDVPDSAINVLASQKDVSTASICIWIPGIAVGGQWIPGRKVCF